MTEKDIIYEVGRYWVSRERDSYAVWRHSESSTHSISDSAYPKTPDGLSSARARCDYLAKAAGA